MKVSPEEEARLLQLALAQGVSVPRLLVESALAGGAETASERRNAIAELFAVHRLLANVANNVNQIARTVNTAAAAVGVEPELRRQVEADLARVPATLNALQRTAERIDACIDGLAL